MSPETVDIPGFEEIFKFIKINFWIMGIPYEKKVKLRYYVILYWLIIMTSLEILYFVSRFSIENFLELTHLAPCICIGLLSVIKLIFICNKRHSVFKFIDRLKILNEDIIRYKRKTSLVKSNLAFLKYLTKYFITLNGVLVSVYNFATIVLMLYTYLKTNTVQFIIPYAIFLPFTLDSWSKWFIVYMYSIISGYMCVLCVSTVDALYFIMTTYTCSSFTILSEEIKELKANTTYLLKEIVKKHQSILEMSIDLDAIFTESNLFNFMICTIVICALGFNLTMGSYNQLPGVILFLVTVLLQIFMISVYGENLSIESRKISESAFETEWYTMDEKSKKKIFLLMLRATRPQHLTAYKYSIISYMSFTKIISTSWSYFTILKAVYKAPGQISN